jgi:hypothetical protein
MRDSRKAGKSPARRRVPRATEALIAFLDSQSELLQFGGLLQSLPKLLDEVETHLPESEELGHLTHHGFHTWEIIRDRMKFTRLTDETVLCRFVDTFHVYLADLIRIALKKEPRLLRSGAMLRADEILEYRSIAEVMEYLIAKKVDELAYAGFAAVLRYVRDGMGAKVTIETDTISKATRAIAVRNIIVHNRGVVNDRFIAQTCATDVHSGERYCLRTNDVFSWMDALRAVISELDTAVATHLKLARKRPVRRRAPLPPYPVPVQ